MSWLLILVFVSSDFKCILVVYMYIPKYIDFSIAEFGCVRLSLNSVYCVNSIAVQFNTMKHLMEEGRLCIICVKS